MPRLRLRRSRGEVVGRVTGASAGVRTAKGFLVARPHARAAGRPRAVEVDALRFAAGWRLLGREAEADAGPAEPDEPSLRFDVIRAADLVALSVAAVNCELVAGGESPPALRPIQHAEARLVVTFPYQHLAEEAAYEGRVKKTDPPVLAGGDGGVPTPETTKDDPDVLVTPLVDVRPARSSRLVFAVPAEESIEFSSAGILAAMMRLELVVHPLALPGDRPTTGSIGDAPFVFLPGGPDTSTAEGLAFQARELRRARTALAAQTGVAVARTVPADAPTAVPDLVVGDLVVSSSPIFGIGGLVTEPGPRPRRPRAKLSRRPTDRETSIEAPFRLVISPSTEARWSHATDPVPAADEQHHVELWHSRL